MRARLNRLCIGKRKLKATRVYGYGHWQGMTKLSRKINEYTHFPDMIYKQFGLVLEESKPEGYQLGTVEKVVIYRVKGILRHL